MHDRENYVSNVAESHQNWPKIGPESDQNQTRMWQINSTCDKVWKLGTFLNKWPTQKKNNNVSRGQKLGKFHLHICTAKSCQEEIILIYSFPLSIHFTFELKSLHELIWKELKKADQKCTHFTLTFTKFLAKFHSKWCSKKKGEMPKRRLTSHMYIESVTLE